MTRITEYLPIYDNKIIVGLDKYPMWLVGQLETVWGHPNLCNLIQITYMCMGVCK